MGHEASQPAVLLVRRELMSKYELRHAEKYFAVEESRVQCRDCLVIGLYSVLPFYDELQRDLQLLGSRLINCLEEHCWITSFAYYEQLREYTPESWSEEEIYQCGYHGPFVVKGKTSPRKKKWKTHMFAATKREALALGQRLAEDGDIREQGGVV